MNENAERFPVGTKVVMAREVGTVLGRAASGRLSHCLHVEFGDRVRLIAESKLVAAAPAIDPRASAAWVVVQEDHEGTVRVTGPFWSSAEAVEAMDAWVERCKQEWQDATDKTEEHDSPTTLLHDKVDPDGETGDASWFYVQRSR
jgi:hypothetical protein